VLGTVELYADYAVPVDAVRAETKRILDATDLWDGNVWGLQVTAATKRALTLRVLLSAADASKAWDLRCLVRERLFAFLQASRPECLPKVRADLAGSNGAGLPS
jgi:hypothetical protein